MTLAVSIGTYGGFYIHWNYGIRICLGWIAFTFFPRDMDDLLDLCTIAIEAGMEGAERWEVRERDNG